MILSQIFGFNFIPILNTVAAKYGVSELTASYTILVFSLSRILFSSSAGAVIDRRGFRYSVLIGLVGISAFSCLRIFASSFWVLLTAQAGISIAVPFIMVAIPKAVATLFPPEDATRVSGYCSIAINLGASSSLWLSPYIILGMGFQRAMIFFTVAGRVLDVRVRPVGAADDWTSLWGLPLSQKNLTLRLSLLSSAYVRLPC